jgi:hypothetical protein
MEPAVVAVAEAAVEASPRGAPETVEEYLKAWDEVAPTIAEPAKPCALDGAPVGSKVVVGPHETDHKVARLVTPNDGAMELPKSDLASGLPIGAKIRKKMEGLFVAEQLNPSKPHEPVTFSSAREAITQFRTTFASD